MVADEIVVDYVEENWSQASSGRYFTHMCGTRPYMVRVEGATVEIYKEVSDEYDDDTMASDQVSYRLEREYHNCGQIWLYRDEDGVVGSTVLFQTATPHEYVFVSATVSRFRTSDSLVAFHSPMKHDLPYPYAVDAAGRYYLLWCDVVLSTVPAEHQSDPSRYWIRESMVADGMRVGQPDSAGLFVLNLQIEPQRVADDFWRYERLNREKCAAQNRDQAVMQAMCDHAKAQPPLPEDHPQCLVLTHPEGHKFRISLADWGQIHAQFPFDESPLVPESVAVRRRRDEAWQQVNLQQFQAFQTEWRDRLSASHLQIQNAV